MTSRKRATPDGILKLIRALCMVGGALPWRQPTMLINARWIRSAASGLEDDFKTRPHFLAEPAWIGTAFHPPAGYRGCD